MARIFRDLDEIAAALDEEMGPTGWLTVDQARIDAFAETTGDRQWIHVDPGRAVTGPYGGTIAHGYLTLSLIPGFGEQLFTFAVGSGRANYGVNRVRFPAPVPAGSRLRAVARFVDLRKTPAGAAVTVRYTIEVEGGSKPACVAETVTLVLPARDTTPPETDR
jgi:acyl dehydratase